MFAFQTRRFAAALVLAFVATMACAKAAEPPEIPTPAAGPETTAAAQVTTPASDAPAPAPAPSTPSPYGALGRTLFGSALAGRHIALMGWAEASGVADDTGHANVAPAPFFEQKTGLNLNQLAAMLCSGDACPPGVLPPEHNVQGRIGPFPEPPSRGVSVDFNLTLLEGVDAAFDRTLGFDAFHFDHSQREKFAIPQAFLDVHLPLLDGTDVLIGSFQTSLANEIGYPFEPPNSFVTHTYAFAHGPAKHVGVLAQTKLPTTAAFGLLSLEYGAVRGWNNASDPNGDWDFIGAVRYRTTDLKTWIDIEGIVGNGNNDGGPTAAAGGSPYFALSSTGRYLERYDLFIVVRRTLSPKLELQIELNEGRQEAGDLAPQPFFITKNAVWYGADAVLRRQLTSKLAVAGRVEGFVDRQGANAAWTGSPGTVWAETGDLEFQLTRAVRARAELRYDSFDGRAGALPLFADHRSDHQLVGLLDVFTAF